MIDEWEVDLYTLAIKSNIWVHLTDDEKRQLKKIRRWIAAVKLLTQGTQGRSTTAPTLYSVE